MRLFSPGSQIPLVALLLLSGFLATATIAPGSARAQSDQRPNIVFIMADDLGYGDLGCYGQRLIKTPRLDRMAAEGIQFRNMYAGCTVCAPSRSVLMTGQHMGHTHVRGNAGGENMSSQSLRIEDVTVAEVLSAVGYRTALCGKWGLGDETLGGYSGLPTHQGFDFFYGYLNQVHAHNYYPEFLWRNREKVPLNNVVERSGRAGGGFEGGQATKRVDYSHDLIVEQALKWVKENQDQPFFLYVPFTIPHANNEGTRMTGDGQEVPDYGIYADEDWPKQDKGQAAMITRMDGDVGRLLDLLAELGLDEKTLVIFTSDNGPHDEGGHNPERFTPSGPLRGMKRDLYEGGIRVPFIARWPGTTPAGIVSDHIGYFGDLMATAADLAGTAPPENIDSISFAPTLTGDNDAQQQHEFLYWEFYERGGKQAVRFGDWKAVRMPMHSGEIELYDLKADLGESNNIADSHTDRVQQAAAMMDAAHMEHPNWQPRGQAGKPPVPGDGRPRF
jgi:arylsulfatase A-like enzyme